MAMSKKTYIKLAEILNQNFNRVQDPNEHQRLVFDALVSNICTMLKEDNDRFDNQRFRDAIYK